MNNLVYKYDLNGNSIGPTFGIANGTALGHLASPSGVAVDTNLNVYVAEIGNNRVQMFDSTGTAVVMIPSASTVAGTGNGQFSSPRGIAFSGNKLFVADTGNNRVEVLTVATNTLTYQSQFTAGSAPIALNFPFGVTADTTGNIFVCNYGGAVVQKFSPTGSYLAQVSGPGSNPGQFSSPAFVAVDSNQNVYVCDANNYLVDKFAPY